MTRPLGIALLGLITAAVVVVLYAPLLIVIRLEQFDYAGAAALGLVMLLASFGILLLLNLLQRHIAGRAR